MRIFNSRLFIALGAFFLLCSNPATAREEKPWRGLKNAYLSVVLNSSGELISNAEKLVNAVIKDGGTEFLEDMWGEFGLTETFDREHLVVMELLNDRKYPGTFYLALGADGAGEILRKIFEEEDVEVPELAEDIEFELDFGDGEPLYIKVYEGWMIIADDKTVTRRAAKAVTLKTPSRHEEYFIRAHLKNSELQDAHGALIKSTLFAGKAMAPLVMNEFPGDDNQKKVLVRLYESALDILTDALDSVDAVDIFLTFNQDDVNNKLIITPSKNSMFSDIVEATEEIDFTRDYLLMENGYYNTIVNTSKSRSLDIVENLALKTAFVLEGEKAGHYRCATHTTEFSTIKSICKICNSELVMGAAAREVYPMIAGIITGQRVQSAYVTPDADMYEAQYYECDIDIMRKLFITYTEPINKLLANAETPLRFEYNQNVTRGPLGPIDNLRYYLDLEDYEDEPELKQQMTDAMATYIKELSIVTPVDDGVCAIQGRDTKKRYAELVQYNVMKTDNPYKGPAWKTAAPELKKLVAELERPPFAVMELRPNKYYYHNLRTMAGFDEGANVNIEELYKTNDAIASTLHVTDAKRLVSNIVIPVKVISNIVSLFNAVAPIHVIDDDELDAPMDELDGIDVEEDIW